MDEPYHRLQEQRSFFAPPIIFFLLSGRENRLAENLLRKGGDGEKESNDKDYMKTQKARKKNVKPKKKQHVTLWTDGGIAA